MRATRSLRWGLLLLVGASIVGAQGPEATLPVPRGDEPADEQRWSTAPEQVLAYSQETARPVYVYIWAKYHPGCISMAGQTLPHPQVAAQLADFNLLALDAHNRGNFTFFDKYKIPYYRFGSLLVGDEQPQEDEPRVMVAPRWPTNLFLDAHGNEVFRYYGFVPPERFAGMLGQIRELVQQREALRQEPESAAAAARVGHLYTRLQVYREAQKHLQLALQLDPENVTGVHADVTLDLTIMSIPEDPAATSRTLREWQRDNPGHPRHLEALYFEAVAQVADDHYEAAERLLSRFEQAAPGSPEYDSPWYLPARQLLHSIRTQVQQ